MTFSLGFLFGCFCGILLALLFGIYINQKIITKQKDKDDSDWWKKS